MWFDDLNKKIKEGEDNNHSSHTDTAWNDMEHLLDKHLPREKKRRRFIFFLLPLLLGAGIATFYFLSKPAKPVPITTTNRELPTARTSQTEVPREDSKTARPALPVTGVAGEEKTTDVISEKKEPGTEQRVPGIAQQGIQKQVINKKDQPESAGTYNDPTQAPIQTTSAKNRQTVPTPNTPADGSDASDKKPAREAEPAKLPVAIIDIDVAKDETTTAVNDADSVVKTTDDTTQQPAPKDSAVTGTQKEPAVQKSKSSFGNKFSISLSMGPDISAVGIDKPGRVQFQYGIGVAYALTSNLAIRTGFYAGDKKYDADSADYHMPYPIHKLEKVEADCYVFEIPLSLVYHFRPEKKQSWFVSGGVSSYIMKRETYGYYYKNSWGQSQYYDRTYKNENTHLFSVIGLSGGYQHRLSDKLSLQAEPYLRIPVEGIGVGKVKLNNTGVLFTINYKPFSKK